MKRDPVLMWLIGAMFVVILALAGALNTYYLGRLDRMENKLDAIQREYGRIAAIETLLRETQQEQQQLKRQVDQIYGELIRR